MLNARVRLLLLTLVGVLSLASGPSKAFAGTYTIPFSGYSFIGEIGGETWLGTSSDFGSTCTWKRLASGETWTINGTGSFDLIEILADSSLSWCGYTMYGILPYNPINLFGNGGTDFLVGGWGSAIVNGGSGNDDINGRRSNVTVSGNTGSDHIYQVQNNTATVNGDAGDETVCIYNSDYSDSGTVKILNGGSHVSGDRRCGSGTQQTINFEGAENCGAPCFF